jgi:hypothetical protein
VKRAAANGHGPLTAHGWNLAFPQRQRVRYFPVIGGTEYVDTFTRGAAFDSSSREPVVFLEGRSGYVTLRALQPLKEVTP